VAAFLIASANPPYLIELARAPSPRAWSWLGISQEGYKGKEAITLDLHPIGLHLDAGKRRKSHQWLCLGFRADSPKQGRRLGNVA